MTLTDKCLCLSSFSNSRGIILPAMVQEHSFVLNYFGLGDFNELVQKKKANKTKQKQY